MNGGDTYTSKAGEGRKYFIAALCVIGFLALIGAVFGGFLGWAATRWAVGGGAETAAAHLFVPVPVSHRYSVSAVFDVPRSPDAVHSTPSLQFELFGSGTRRARYAAGLQRRTQDGDRLTGFVYSMGSGGRTRTNDLPAMPDGPHRATVNVDDDRITFSIDGHAVNQIRDATFANGSVRYVSVGTYVGVAGEHAVGTISDIRMQSIDDLGMRSIPDPCVVTTHGLSLVRVADSWALSGINRPSERPVHSGCKDLQRRGV